MIGIDVGNYNLIIARQQGNETTTLQDPTGLRQVPTAIYYDQTMGRIYRTRNSKAQRDFIHNLETADTVEKQMQQIKNLNNMIAFANQQFQLNGQSIVCAFPAHYSQQSRLLVTAILGRHFKSVQTVPQHLAIAAQYFFRRFSELQARPVKMGFLQINEFDTVYSSFFYTKQKIQQFQFKVVYLGSRDIDMLIYRMCQDARGSRDLPDASFEKYLQDVKKVKVNFSLRQRGVVQFPEFDVPLEYKDFSARFQFYQDKIRALIESDLEGLELLGGGARLLDQIQTQYAKIITKRLNPDEAAAQGAICFYLLQVTNKLQAEWRYVGQELYVNDQVVLRAGDSLPLEKQVNLKNPAAGAQLRLANNFIIQSYQLNGKKAFQAPRLVVAVDNFGQARLSFENCEATEVFNCLQDQQLIGSVANDEAQWASVEHAHQQLLERELLAGHADKPGQESHLQQFVEIARSGAVDMFMTEAEKGLVDELMQQRGLENVSHAQNEAVMSILARRNAYENYERLLAEYHEHARERVAKVKDQLGVQQLALVEQHQRQVEGRVRELVKAHTGGMEVCKLLEQGEFDKFFQNEVLGGQKPSFNG